MISAFKLLNEDADEISLAGGDILKAAIFRQIDYEK
jgi:hypothetical protein